MKTLKSIFILILFSTLIASCTIEDLVEESETNAVENTHTDTQNIQATGGESNETVDVTEKDD